MTRLDAAIERYHAAAFDLVNGNPEPQKTAFSDSDDVTLVNPVGSWSAVISFPDDPVGLSEKRCKWPYRLG